MLFAAPAAASCSTVDPSTLQRSFPSLGAGAAAALAPALSDVATLGEAEERNRSMAGARERRVEQLRQQVANYDAQRARARAPLNFRNGQALLRGLLQGNGPDPAHIAAARAELKAAERGPATGSAGADGGTAGVDTRLAAAIDRVTRDIASDAPFPMLVDADRLMRERVADCAAWRGSAGGSLTRSLEALDRQDQALRSAIGTAAAGVAPKAKAEIAAASDSASLERLARSYTGTPATAAAMERVGVAQALAARQAVVGGAERSAAAAAQARRDAESAARAKVAAAEQARADAAERTLEARQRAAAGGGSTRGGGGGASVSGEPTEAQMRKAIQNRLDGAQQAMAEKRAACKSGSGGDNPIVAVQCIALLGPEAAGVATPHVSITYFEKLNCGAATTGGYLCDYVIAADAGQYSSLTGPQTANKRFVNTPARGWIVLD